MTTENDGWNLNHVDALMAENKRLRADLDHLMDAAVTYMDTIDRLRAALGEEKE